MASTAPSTTVVIVTHDSRADIEACLGALAAQRGVRFETLVVDNGSRDGTPALIRQRFPAVRVIEQANVGFGGGNNRGVREASGEAIVFLNPDTVPDPDFVVELVAALAPGRAATAQVVLKDDPRQVNTVGHRLHFTGYGFVVGYKTARLPPGPPLPASGVSGAAFAMRRDDFLRLGGFDEDFFLYMEDTELSWRLQRARFDVVLAPSAVVAHDYEFSLSASKVGRLETGRLLLLRKHLPWYLWVAYLPSLLLAELMAWARAASYGREGLAAKAGSLRAGMRRSIRRYDLPRVRPHRFAVRAFPFRELSGSRAVATLGAIANALFWLNTVIWPLRRSAPHTGSRGAPGPRGVA